MVHGPLYPQVALASWLHHHPTHLSAFGFGTPSAERTASAYPGVDLAKRWLPIPNALEMPIVGDCHKWSSPGALG